MKKLLIAALFPLLFSACGKSSGEEYLGHWTKVVGQGPDLTIEKHGDVFVIKEPSVLMAARGNRQAPMAANKAVSSESGYDNQILYRAPHLSYEVHRDGVVTYQHDGRSVVRDHGSAVRVLKTDPAAIEAALRLSQAKFGPVLKLQGPVEMQREAARVAAEAGLYVEFSDNSLNDIMHARRVELIADRATVLETRSKDRSRGRDAPAKPTPAGQDHAPDPVPGMNSPPDEDLRPSSRSGRTL